MTRTCCSKTLMPLPMHGAGGRGSSSSSRTSASSDTLEQIQHTITNTPCPSEFDHWLNDIEQTLQPRGPAGFHVSIWTMQLVKMESTGVIGLRMQANAAEDSLLTGCLLAQRERKQNRRPKTKKDEYAGPYSRLSGHDASKPLFGNIFFYKFNMILSGSFAAASCLVIFTLMFLHATHLSKRNKQIKFLPI
ncbi:hypothetical protein CTA1_6665 [Colletotrichum tanaceti]|uniref:Uncharacterized protein n=1 Tax=Colletotrichum tanaceti TaxID=1306861 RepID=A0A4U6XN95_9PEZI|nr:hypothetical protein CTA1_6665 [Colletotrichum tanaceti]